MVATDKHTSIHEFVKSYALLWGEDEVESLLDSGYEPVLTTAGWKWLYTKDESTS